MEDLPPELREYIFKYCQIIDLKNLACCSKQYRNYVEYLLWKETFLTWKSLADKSLKMPTQLILTTKLNFSYGWNPQNDVPSWNHIATNYTKVLQGCKVARLRKLSIEGDIPDNALHLTVDILFQLQELSLSLMQNNSTTGWRCLVTLVCLKKLNIYYCRIHDIGVDAIIKVPNLEQLHLKACKDIRDTGLKYISSLTQLQRLAISHNQFITENGLVFISKLVNLIELDVKYTELNDDVLNEFCQCLINLQTLDISECHNLTNVGLSRLCLLKKLRNLNISGCNNATDCGLASLNSLDRLREINIQFNNFSDSAIEEFCHVTGMKQKMKSFKFVLTRDARFWLKNGKCGVGWKCDCPVLAC